MNRNPEIKDEELARVKLLTVYTNDPQIAINNLHARAVGNNS